MSATELLEILRLQNRALVTAESCTGGLLSAAITDCAGCSDVFLHGHIVYSNAAKICALQVSDTLIAAFGAVSAEVAAAMAKSAALGGSRLNAKPCLGLAITGVAGPASSERKPVGQVFLAACLHHPEQGYSEILPQKLSLHGRRAAIRQQSVTAALKLGVKHARSVAFQG